MYSREIDGENLTFASVGILYEDTFVLFDEETESLWYHLEGDAAMTAISGKYAGMRTAELPAAYTTWNVWRKLHPDTGYLDPVSLPQRSTAGGRRGGLDQSGQPPEGFEPPEGFQPRQRPEGFEPPEGAQPSDGERTTRRDRVLRTILAAVDSTCREVRFRPRFSS